MRISAATQGKRTQVQAVSPVSYDGAAASVIFSVLAALAAGPILVATAHNRFHSVWIDIWIIVAIIIGPPVLLAMWASITARRSRRLLTITIDRDSRTLGWYRSAQGMRTTEVEIIRFEDIQAIYQKKGPSGWEVGLYGADPANNLLINHDLDNEDRRLLIESLTSGSSIQVMSKPTWEVEELDESTVYRLFDQVLGLKVWSSTVIEQSSGLLRVSYGENKLVLRINEVTNVFWRTQFYGGLGLGFTLQPEREIEIAPVFYDPTAFDESIRCFAESIAAALEKPCVRKPHYDPGG